jgi:hypothetical protein
MEWPKRPPGPTTSAIFQSFPWQQDWSMIVTVKVQMELFPLESLALQVTTVSPGGKKEPEGGKDSTLGSGSQLSDALTEKKTRAPLGSRATATWSGGHVICGGTLSRTVTVKLQVFVLPLASKPVETTVVTPGGNKEPEGGTEINAGWGSQLSRMSTLKETVVPPKPRQLVTILVGQNKTGAWLSPTNKVALELVIEPNGLLTWRE